MKTLNRRGCAAVLGAALSLVSSAALADQFVVLDETWVHTPDLPDSHYRVLPAAGTPDNWVSPVDYSQGSAWVYLEVHTKPTDQPTKFQVCFEATPTYACTAQSPTYTTTGTYEWETKFSDFWSPPGEFVDWTQGDNKIACILKDTMNNKPSADNVGADVAALYTPTEVRMVVTIVAPGSTYTPPTPTGQGGSGGMSMTGSGGSGGTGGTGGAGGGGATGGAGNGGAAGSQSTGGASTGGTGGTGGSSSGGGKDGCSCSVGAAAGSEISTWWALAGVAAAVGLRRGRRRLSAR